MSASLGHRPALPIPVPNLHRHSPAGARRDTPSSQRTRSRATHKEQSRVPTPAAGGPSGPAQSGRLAEPSRASGEGELARRATSGACALAYRGAWTRPLAPARGVGGRRRGRQLQERPSLGSAPGMGPGSLSRLASAFGRGAPLPRLGLSYQKPLEIRWQERNAGPSPGFPGGRPASRFLMGCPDNNRIIL